jgi:dipeptide/tripeptide permease
MSAARKLLFVSGLALAVWGMVWGLVYALFFEHQALDAMGGQITAGFVRASQLNLPAAHAALAGYAHSEFNYVRQVDVHSHWIGLAMILIVLGIVLDRMNLDARRRWWLALMLAIGSAVFPLGVILQTLIAGLLPSVFAVIGAGLVIAGMAVAVWGFARAPRSA